MDGNNDGNDPTIMGVETKFSSNNKKDCNNDGIGISRDGYDNVNNGRVAIQHKFCHYGNDNGDDPMMLMALKAKMPPMTTMRLT